MVNSRRPSIWPRLVLASVAAILLLCAAFLALTRLPLHVYDNFESSTLSWRWSTRRLEPGSARAEHNIVHSGRQALAITVHSNDRYEAASDIGTPTERDEIMESWWLYSHIGRTYVYSFSLFLPEDLPRNARRLVIAQWRQLCEARSCRPDYPIIALRYQQGLLEITREDNAGRHVLYQSPANYSGQWLNFRFVIKFDAHQGSIHATLNRAPIVDYEGPTVFLPAPGFPAHGPVYFKTGLYRDALNDPPWTLYVDDYRKDECPSAGCQ